MRSTAEAELTMDAADTDALRRYWVIQRQVVRHRGRRHVWLRPAPRLVVNGRRLSITASIALQRAVEQSQPADFSPQFSPPNEKGT